MTKPDYGIDAPVVIRNLFVAAGICLVIFVTAGSRDRKCRIEGVNDRVGVRTADMRELPFANATFDVVVSCEAIHNIYSADQRAKAIREISRVLKPSGRALIVDIRHLREYTAIFAENGFTDVRKLGSELVKILLAVITMGGLRPGAILVKGSKRGL